jgi:Protein similar to CwfJ C-terminus 1
MVRVLVCGDPSADAAFVASKLSALCTKSGPFAFALLTHPPFLPTSSAHAKPPIFPIPTYYSAQHKPDQAQLTPANLLCAGPAAALHLHGLTVLLVAPGYDDPPPGIAASLPPELDAALTEAGARGTGFRGVDILVAPTLPRGIALPLPPASEGHFPPSALIARVAAEARPRYHFACAKGYTALAPYVVRGAVHATRFFTLAPAVRGKGKERWVYAADVAPLSEMTPADLAATRTVPELPAPYSATFEDIPKPFGSTGTGVGNGTLSKVSNWKPAPKRPRSDTVLGTTVAAEAGAYTVYKRLRYDQSIQTPSDAGCWFCLANGKDPHLVLAVGNDFYVAAAKGGIVPEHFLIVSIGHARHSLDPSLTPAMHAEVSSFKVAIAKFYAETLDCALPYFFERALRTRGGDAQMHMHIQCIPIKASAVAGGRDIALSTGASLDLKLEALDVKYAGCIPRLRQACSDECGIEEDAWKTFEFFWAELPDKSSFVHLVSSISASAVCNTLPSDRPASTAPAAPVVTDEHKPKPAANKNDEPISPIQDVAPAGIRLPLVPADLTGDSQANIAAVNTSRTADDSENVAVASATAAAEISPTGASLDATATSALAAPVSTEIAMATREAALSLAKADAPVPTRIFGKHATRHPLYFGRKIATTLLDVPNRTDWKRCVGALKEELRITEQMREAFAPYALPTEDDDEDVGASV